MRSQASPEGSLGGRHRVGLARVDLHGVAQRPRQGLEAAFDDMMVVVAVQAFHVQGGARRLGKGLEPLLEQLGIHGAQLVAPERHLPDQVGPVGQVESDTGQRLVHGHIGRAIAVDTLAVAQRLVNRLADGNADILGGVVSIDMQITLGRDGQVHQRVPGQLFQHVIEKAHPGLHRIAAGPVQSHRYLDPGLGGAALDAALAHENLLMARISLVAAMTAKGKGTGRLFEAGGKDCGAARCSYMFSLAATYGGRDGDVHLQSHLCPGGDGTYCDDRPQAGSRRRI
ncbi:hypothetical protein MCP1_120006 [Candidatus Terasakiella magnetica]|nr:hypothetical protein MCP1_120006 [Candidatus Terasakiella magnetica]